MGEFNRAVAGLRADLAEHPLTKGVMSSDQALLGFKAAIDAALGRGSQALTEWIEGFSETIRALRQPLRQARQWAPSPYRLRRPA
jgi:hypothetical protein